MFLLGQTSETVESIRKSGRLAVSEGCYELLKTVHTLTGVYSEIFIKSATGIGIGRLIVSEFEKLLYSTSAADVAAIGRYTAEGADIFSAISSVLRERGIESEEYEQIDEEYLEEERTDRTPVQLPENSTVRNPAAAAGFPDTTGEDGGEN
jgi:conjugal transfer ATP-binding protein TraC